jgi:hypothetical protein
MKELDLMLANSQMRMIKLVLQNSINDIKENNPHRMDLIQSMEKRLAELHEIHLTYLRLENEHKMIITKLYDLHRENLELKKQNKDLNEII